MAKHSSLKLIMGQCGAYQRKRDGTLEEVPSVYDISNGRGKFEGNRFTTARFWKNISTRYWQYDDFKFEGAAAASFLGNAHRFKIWFNPLESYKLLMRAALDLYGDKNAEKGMAGMGGRSKRGRKPSAKDATLPSEEDIKKEAEKAEKEWESVLANTHPKCPQLQADYGWSPNLYKELVESKKKGEWTDRGWELWCVALVSSPYLFTNVTAIMVHEEQHIILNHLNRNGKRDPYQMNLAQDYAINQELDWSDEVKKVLITCENETFFQRFVISYVKYLLITENDLRPEIEDKFGLKLVMIPGGDERQNLQAFIDKAIPQVDKIFDKYMLQGDSWNHTDKTSGKSSDFYYRVLMETMIFQGGSGNGKGDGKGNGGVRGYDGHGTWDEIAEDEDSEDGEGDAEGKEKDGEGKGKPKDGEGKEEGEDSDFNKIKGKAQGGKIDQIRKAPKGNKAKGCGNTNSDSDEKKDGEDENVQAGSRVKDRGKGEGAGAEHAGFDVTTACSRQEIKSSVRDALERSGLNPDDPEDLARALGRIPGMGNLGTIISEFFKVPTKNWQQILANYLATSINAKEKDYTMSRENRRIPGVFPGQRRERGLDVVIAVDTSGSINYNDYNDFVCQIEKIVKDCDLTKVRLIQCHHTIAYDKEVILSRIKKIPICETGGTTMRVVYEKLKKEGNRKLLILFTDGCIDDFLQKDYPGFKSIMFLSRGNGAYAKPLIDRGFKVINQDQE